MRYWSINHHFEPGLIICSCYGVSIIHLAQNLRFFFKCFATTSHRVAIALVMMSIVFPLTFFSPDHHHKSRLAFGSCNAKYGHLGFSFLCVSAVAFLSPSRLQETICSQADRVVAASMAEHTPSKDCVSPRISAAHDQLVGQSSMFLNAQYEDLKPPVLLPL